MAAISEGDHIYLISAIVSRAWYGLSKVPPPRRGSELPPQKPATVAACRADMQRSCLSVRRALPERKTCSDRRLGDCFVSANFPLGRFVPCEPFVH